MTPAGLEPAIPGSVGRRLIHWAMEHSVWRSSWKHIDSAWTYFALLKEYRNVLPMRAMTRRHYQDSVASCSSPWRRLLTGEDLAGPLPLHRITPAAIGARSVRDRCAIGVRSAWRNSGMTCLHGSGFCVHVVGMMCAVCRGSGKGSSDR